MNRTTHRVGDKICPYCLSEGPFVSMGSSYEVDSGQKWTYLECLECGNTSLRHRNSKEKDSETPPKFKTITVCGVKLRAYAGLNKEKEGLR